MEKAVCNVCGATYEDKESIELVKQWRKEGYAPCPNVSCWGEMAIKEVNNEGIQAGRRNLQGS